MSASDEFDASRIIGSELYRGEVSYTTRDAILYALGVGATDLRHVYEDHEGAGGEPRPRW